MKEHIPHFAIVLSGSGVFDGSEIPEATCTLLAIDELGCKYTCFAPNIWQEKTIDHFTGNVTSFAGDDDNRNVLAESARIARGEIKDLKEFKASDFDAIIFPGGFGAAMNLSNFATKGKDCSVNEEVERAIQESYRQGIIIGAMCIAPVILAKVLGEHKIRITIGNDKATAQGVEAMGAVHENCSSTEVCADEINRIVTVPCYMLAKSIREIGVATRNLVDEAIELMQLYSHYHAEECHCGCGHHHDHDEQDDHDDCHCGGGCGCHNHHHH
ncbi:MAG: isoprenoid biosynthesis glyoxalase ElbB [Lactobacillus sp.]|jgi:enhancing lycopene biosynthesis protein 2|nr:isoprenoid biosynthesis glyoxalase ElbB [Lactobacillus sp.]